MPLSGRRLLLALYFGVSMKLLMLFIFLFHSASSSSEDICIDKNKMYTLSVYHELIGENRKEIVYNMELSEMTLRVIDKISGNDQASTIESLDNFQELYLDRILTVIETQKKLNIEVTLYENRLSEILNNIENREKYFPVTLKSSSYKKVREEVNKRI